MQIQYARMVREIFTNIELEIKSVSARLKVFTKAKNTQKGLSLKDFPENKARLLILRLALRPKFSSLFLPRTRRRL